MQTFLPIASTNFALSAATLDNLRLNKQTLEAWQILMNLLQLGPEGNYRAPKGWRNHPAVKMWEGHEEALYLYIKAMGEEWLKRGHKTVVLTRAEETIKRARATGLTDGTVTYPTWMTNTEEFENVARSHRQALLTKNYEWYSLLDWPEDTGTRPASYDYFWPTSKPE